MKHYSPKTLLLKETAMVHNVFFDKGDNKILIHFKDLNNHPKM